MCSWGPTLQDGMSDCSQRGPACANGQEHAPVTGLSVPSPQAAVASGRIPSGVARGPCHLDLFVNERNGHTGQRTTDLQHTTHHFHCNYNYTVAASMHTCRRIGYGSLR